MCRLCKGRNSVHQDIGWGVSYRSCPHCSISQSGDLTESIKKLETLIAKMKTRVKQGV
ncbi:MULTISPECIES: hypothetical protein [Bacillus]|uniref:hypothetical protein n=1 Tax=Bacillus TaxID=1386 RepID=UPI0008150142|nr:MULTISPECIES: hypothetical protein [Bacillus]MBU8787275.1 hypothetical protein [Bacillus glycinifermentans]MDU0069473.1 hypothetical protein [Bacillus sp. IG6]MED8017547.1 hypothetical protein [Bacillus glycinifermentans]WKB78643.1 hypothetical protein QYM22_07325 [Bacillus glycinifermentans]SCA85169.1 hypothetical protein BGLY_1346 [Bacillus glycinifermentans]